MAEAQRICTTHAWVAALESQSQVIGQMQVRGKIGRDADLDTLAFNFANSAEHNSLIIRGIESLVATNAAPPEGARDLLANIIKKNTYGAFSELAAYDWLIRKNVKITTQVKLSADNVLGSREVCVDGQIEDVWSAYFDVKGFGFNGFLANRLKELLQKKLPGLHVFVDESWDLSYDEFEAHIRDVAAIADELQTKGHVRCGPMNISAARPQPISVSMRTHDPYALAKKNAVYPFLSANQFTRHKPFVLIYVVHPWLNHLSLDSDFGHMGTIFTRAFARRAFMQFSEDCTLACDCCKQISDGSTLGDASRLLSAIMFVNVWPSDLYCPGSSESRPKPSWIYVNPRATHKLYRRSLRVFQTGHNVFIDDFCNDDY